MRPRKNASAVTLTCSEGEPASASPPGPDALVLAELDAPVASPLEPGTEACRNLVRACSMTAAGHIAED